MAGIALMSTLSALWFVRLRLLLFMRALAVLAHLAIFTLVLASVLRVARLALSMALLGDAIALASLDVAAVVRGAVVAIVARHRVDRNLQHPQAVGARIRGVVS